MFLHWYLMSQCKLHLELHMNYSIYRSITLYALVSWGGSFVVLYWRTMSSAEWHYSGFIIVGKVLQSQDINYHSSEQGCSSQTFHRASKNVKTWLLVTHSNYVSAPTLGLYIQRMALIKANNLLHVYVLVTNTSSCFYLNHTAFNFLFMLFVGFPPDRLNYMFRKWWWL